MQYAIRSFLILSACLLVLTLSFWVVLRLNGQSQPVARPMEHPFLKTLPQATHQATHKTTNETSTQTSTQNIHRDVVAYHPKGEGSALSRLMASAEISKDLVLWIDVFVNADGRLLLAENGGPPETNPTTLTSALEKLSENRLILNFRGNREGMVQIFAQAIDASQAGNRILVQSPEDGFLKSLREGKPQWLFGTSTPALTRLIMLASIGLESLAPLKSDVLVIEDHPKDHFLDRMTDGLINEMNRRGVKIYAGPVQSTTQALHLWNSKITGILTNDPKLIWPLTHKP